MKMNLKINVKTTSMQFPLAQTPRLFTLHNSSPITPTVQLCSNLPLDNHWPSWKTSFLSPKAISTGFLSKSKLGFKLSLSTSCPLVAPASALRSGIFREALKLGFLNNGISNRCLILTAQQHPFVQNLSHSFGHWCSKCTNNCDDTETSESSRKVQIEVVFKLQVENDCISPQSFFTSLLLLFAIGFSIRQNIYFFSILICKKIFEDNHLLKVLEWILSSLNHISQNS